MSESVNIDRQQGEPLEFRIDLKWALWSANESLWSDYAPNTLAHLRAGFDGAFEEYGDCLVILTAPRKEIRYGRVVVNPKTNQVSVSFRSEFDDDSCVWEVDEFPLPATFDEFMAKVDEVEARLIAQEQAA